MNFISKDIDLHPNKNIGEDNKTVETEKESVIKQEDINVELNLNERFFGVIPQEELIRKKNIIIALLGASDRSISYIKNRDYSLEGLLKKNLSESIDNHNFDILNYADGGDYIKRFIEESRRYQETVQDKIKDTDIVFISYGLNDAKYYSPHTFRKYLEELIGLLLKENPGIKIILETSNWFDYPEHYSDDRNKAIKPYYDIIRALAKEKQFPLLDNTELLAYKKSQGVWDLRIRHQKLALENYGERFIFDSKYDKEMFSKYGVEWFTDAHTNYHGTAIIAVHQYQMLRRFLFNNQ